VADGDRDARDQLQMGEHLKQEGTGGGDVQLGV
jgi:hypothetical protein